MDVYGYVWVPQLEDIFITCTRHWRKHFRILTPHTIGSWTFKIMYRCIIVYVNVSVGGWYFSLVNLNGLDSYIKRSNLSCLLLLSKWDYGSIIGPYVILAHEMGHNFGFSHDEGKNDEILRNPSLNLKVDKVQVGSLSNH